MTMMSEVLSVAEAARRLGMTVDDAYRLVFSLELKTVPAATGRRLVPADVVEQWLASHPANA